jgi:hypothetical protein
MNLGCLINIVLFISFISFEIWANKEEETTLFFLGWIIAFIVFLIEMYIYNNLETKKNLTEKTKELLISQEQLTNKEKEIEKLKRDNLLNERKIDEMFKENLNHRLATTLALKAEYKQKDEEYKQKDIAYKKVEELAKKLTSDLNNGLNYLSEISTDFELMEYSWIANSLKHKKRPAGKSAQEIERFKAKTKKYMQEYKLMKYKYETLFKLFPELEKYTDNLQQIKDNFSGNLKEFQDDFDRVQFYLSKEEYENLEASERNQLALDRYIKREKNNWQIGRDYELYIGHCFEKLGYEVSYFGIEKKLEDLGRDIIAKQGSHTLIIQCKCWSKNKVIHEKHIAQLYGTTIQYIIENNLIPNTVKPVFITNITLSEQARKFAQYLKVDLWENKTFEEFPRIKCNIGKNGEKIYHLPMDQQYDTTIIEPEKGECFCWTVKEAEEKGFRRAKKFYGAKTKNGV